MTGKWERDVPVYNVPLRSKPMNFLIGIVAVGVFCVLYREISGLGPASGMNDAYSWGIWKTFNVMVLTGLGSGAFAVGIAAWVFYREKLHSVMRIALLTSLLAYLNGLILLAIDVGRPWNLYWMLLPWKWNTHSPLLEVMVCMSVYAVVPLALENIPPFMEKLHYDRPDLRQRIEKIESFLMPAFPFVIGLAYALPMMHQSSLGALMLLAGGRLHPLWQTPLLPFLYVWAAAFMGYACVAGTLLLCCLVWNRPIDMDVECELSRISSGLIIGWLVVRFADLIYRGHIKSAFEVSAYAGVFWVEMGLLIAAVWMLRKSVANESPKLMFHAHLIAAFGGMLYRFNPTTFAFQAKPGAFYFPSAVEVIISLTFLSLAIIGFLVAVKKMAILPAPVGEWRRMEAETARATQSDPGVAVFATGQD
jgi:Ni/Fe-hydrogenase subunit HybB-like protein